MNYFALRKSFFLLSNLHANEASKMKSFLHGFGGGALIATLSRLPFFSTDKLNLLQL